jgi:Mg-chelatase subunit ChlD
MSNHQLAFFSPWYLVLLGLIPLLWILSFRSLAGLGRVRRLLALALRSLVVALLIFALAEAQWVRSSERLTVLYVVDQSLSISRGASEEALKYVNEAIRTQRNGRLGDRDGVLVFGRDAAIELPPLDDAQQVTAIEAVVDREYTNIASALKLAQASFPYDSAHRVVLISDGNENIGDSLEQARSLAADGIGIDVLPIRTTARGDVIVEKVAMPTDVRRGQPFELRVVMNNTTPAERGGGRVAGRLEVIRKTGETEQRLADQHVVLEPGKRVFTVREQIDLPDFYTYDARFIPDDAADDALPQNNLASTFTHVRGSGQVLLIEDHENLGEFDYLVQRLRAMNIEVTVRSSRPEDLFGDLAQLQPFDAVLLANVPREQFTDAQIEMLVRNTQNLASGLMMLGGPNSFGAGGWTNTLLEEAMPVDFQIKSLKVVPVGALMIVIDHSGSMFGQKLEMSKAAAIAAFQVLGSRDFIGVVAFDSFAEWVVRMQRIGSGGKIAERIARLAPAGGTNMMPGMTEGYHALAKVDAGIKHMIVLTDGQTEGTGYKELSARMRKQGITTSCVAVGADAASALMASIAQAGGGKFYHVNNPRTIPRIFMKEALRVARPLVFERKEGIPVQVKFPHEMIQGLEGHFPPITGYVLTNAKSNPLVEIALSAPLPTDKGDNPILASWTYGLGKAVAFTSDAGKRWATEWTGWENYDKFFSQVVRWTMRPVGDTGKFSVATDVQDSNIRVVVSALDKDDEFVNFLSIGGSVIGPDLKPLDIDMKQVAPGRYVGEVPARQKGNYFVQLSPGPGRAPLRAGVNIPYSDEFRERDTNEALLREIAGLVPKNGAAGKIIEDMSGASDPQARLGKRLETDTFRHDLAKAISSQDIWHLLVFAAACVFLADVFVRRVTITFAWVPPLAAKLRDRLLRRPAMADVTVVMDRLQRRKAEVSEQLEQRRAATRFESSPQQPTGEPAADLGAAAAPPPKPTQPQSLAPQAEKEPESYTSRLLKAKQKVWEDRDKDKLESPSGQ